MRRSKVKRRPGMLVAFRMATDLVAFLDGWAVEEHTTRSALLVKLVAMAKVGAGLVDNEAAAPLFKEMEGQVEAMVKRAWADQQQRDRTAAIALGGVVSPRSRRLVRK